MYILKDDLKWKWPTLSRWSAMESGSGILTEEWDRVRIREASHLKTSRIDGALMKRPEADDPSTHLDISQGGRTGCTRCFRGCTSTCSRRMNTAF